MMRRRTATAVVWIASVVALVWQPGTAATASAAAQDDVVVQSCYGGSGAGTVTKPAGGFYWPEGVYLITSTNCSDINIRTNNDTHVRVCFFGKGCQEGFKHATPGKWLAVATNVKDDVMYRFQFYNDAAVSGSYAA